MKRRKNPKRKKHQATLLIKPEESLGEKELFENMFKTSNKSNIDLKAREFMSLLPFPDCEWQHNIEKLDITKSAYTSIISKLRGLGIIKKEEGIWRYSDKFARRCTDMANTTRALQINRSGKIEFDAD